MKLYLRVIVNTFIRYTLYIGVCLLCRTFNLKPSTVHVS